MANPYKNDGTLKFGSRQLTIGSGSGGTSGTQIVVTARGSTLNIPTATVERKDTTGKTDGQVSFYTSPPNFTTVIDYPTATSIPPQEGWETTTTFRDADGDGDLDAEVFYLENITIIDDQSDLGSMSVTFRKKIN